MDITISWLGVARHFLQDHVENNFTRLLWKISLDWKWISITNQKDFKINFMSCFHRCFKNDRILCWICKWSSYTSVIDRFISNESLMNREQAHKTSHKCLKWLKRYLRFFFVRTFGAFCITIIKIMKLRTAPFSTMLTN